MENSFLISKKIDSQSCLVFIKNSKKFLIVTNLHLKLFNDFYKISKKDLLKKIHSKFPNSNTSDIYIELKELLNNSPSISIKSKNDYIIPKNLKKFKFKLGDTYYTINYDNQQIINTVIGQLFHLRDSSVSESKNYYVFNANGRNFLNDDNINLGSWDNNEIHYLTGKLLSLIMCDFHDIKEDEWSGFLHASTVSKANNAFVIIGESGSGKSTSCAILSKNGYDLIADDITPLSREGKIGNFPNAISIKEPSFKKIIDLFKNEKLSNTFNVSKGKIKYLNPYEFKRFNPKAINCTTIIRIKYNPKAENKLNKVELKDLLPLLVNESFFPTNSESVNAFMNWYMNCQCYSLNYSNDDSLINCLEKINDCSIPSNINSNH